MYCQTAKTHGEANPFASKKNRGLQAVPEWQVFICIVGRSFGSSVGKGRVYLFPPQKKGEAETPKCCPYVVSAILGCSEFLFYRSNHMNPSPGI